MSWHREAASSLGSRGAGRDLSNYDLMLFDVTADEIVAMQRHFQNSVSSINMTACEMALVERLRRIDDHDDRMKMIDAFLAIVDASLTVGQQPRPPRSGSFA